MRKAVVTSLSLLVLAAVPVHAQFAFTPAPPTELYLAAPQRDAIVSAQMASASSPSGDEPAHLSAAPVMLGPVAQATGGLVITPFGDPSIPPPVVAMILQAVAIYQARFADPIAVNILFRYATTLPDGTPIPAGTLATSRATRYSGAWATYTGALIADAKSLNDAAARASLPVSPLAANVTVTSANGRALSFNTPPLLNANGSVAAGGLYDGIVTLNAAAPFQFTRPTNAQSYDALSTTEHEIDEILGLGSFVNTSSVDAFPEDAYSWSAAGVRNLTAIGKRYFSIDGGVTPIVDFNQNPTGDSGDWSNACPYVQNAFPCPGQYADITATSPEGIALDVIGYDLALPPAVATDAATVLTATNATLNGRAASNGYATDARFQYGITAAYEFSTGAVSIGSSASIIGLSSNLTGLACGTAYHFRVVATNQYGTTNGADATFVTVACPTLPPPTPLAPGTSVESNATSTSLTPTFTWSSVTGATRYGLTVRREPYGATDIVLQMTSLTGTSYVLPGGILQDGVKYRWTMTSFNSAGSESAVSAALYFRTPSTTVPPPATQGPGTATDTGFVVTGVTPTLTWTAVSGATRYGLYIWREPYAVANLVYQNVSLTETSFSLPNGALQIGVKYRWTMTAFSAAGIESPQSRALYFRTLPPPVGTPTGLRTSSTGTTVFLAWSAPTSGGAPTAYIIEAGSAPGLANLVNFSTGNTETTFSAAGVPFGAYYVRVKAMNAAGPGSASNESLLLVGTPPEPPQGLTTSMSGSTAFLAWAPPLGGSIVTNYVIEAGSAPGLSNLASFATGDTATAYVAGNVGPGVYYVRVRAANAVGLSAPSNETVLVVACAAPAAPSGLINTYNSFGTVAFSWLPSAGATTYIVEAGSAPGLADLANSDLGSAAPSFTTASVRAGTYFVRLRAQNSCGVSATSNEVTLVVP